MWKVTEKKMQFVRIVRWRPSFCIEFYLAWLPAQFSAVLVENGYGLAFLGDEVC